jgi:hypothetical protein
LQRHELDIGEASISVNQLKASSAILSDIENLRRGLAQQVSLYSEASARALGEEERRASIEMDFEKCRNELHTRLHQLELNLSETQMALDRKSETIDYLQQNSDTVTKPAVLNKNSVYALCAKRNHRQISQLWNTLLKLAHCSSKHAEKL